MLSTLSLVEYSPGPGLLKLPGPLVLIPIWNLPFSLNAAGLNSYSPGPGTFCIFFISKDVLLPVPNPNAAAVVFVN